MKKIFLWVVLVAFSSIGIAEQIATSFVYPLGISIYAPTEQAGNSNGFQITQNFNTDFVYRGTPSIPSSPNGGWCSGGSTISSQALCEATVGNKWYYGHTGVDLSKGGITSGTVPIFAIANGKVIYSGDNGDKYGYKIKIRHTLPSGKIIYSLYGHRSSIMLAANQDVVKGQLIGYVGNTGGNYPVHLHFAIYDNAINSSDVAQVPVGYAYADASNTMRYFYDPLLFVNDRNSDWATTTGGAGYWYIQSASFSKSIPTRTAYITNSAGVSKSFQSAVNAGWISPNIYWVSGSSWSYYAGQPVESNTLYPNLSPYIIQTLTPSLTFHLMLPGNNYLDARWRQDMMEFTTVNSSLGFGRALRETYNPYTIVNWDPNYYLGSMQFVQTVGGVPRNATVYLAYSATDPMVRYVMYYNPFTYVYSNWVRVY